MPRWCRASSYTLTRIAETGAGFADFAPYVPAISDDARVAFQAALRNGATGVYTGAGGPVSMVLEAGHAALETICSHADLNAAGATCFYAQRKGGAGGVFLHRADRLIALADSCGPLGPTINHDATAAFRAHSPSGQEGIFRGSEASVTTLAMAGNDFTTFHGLPVINRSGTVAFRADHADGAQGISISDGTERVSIVRTGEHFASLGPFPVLTDAGDVAFCATLLDGTSGAFVASRGEITPLLDSTGPFGSFRGVLLNNTGHAVFYAIPRGEQLGIFTGPDPTSDCLLQLGAPLFGSTLTDFALNPVSINDAGQLAIRVKLADDRQFILRADRAAPPPPRPPATSAVNP